MTRVQRDHKSSPCNFMTGSNKGSYRCAVNGQGAAHYRSEAEIKGPVRRDLLSGNARRKPVQGPFSNADLQVQTSQVFQYGF
jgi:hypothetical protein